MTIIFVEKTGVVAPQNIHQKQKTESIYLITKNNFDPFSEIGIYKILDKIFFFFFFFETKNKM